ncbi:terpenoid synthase [Dichomitus squalens]|uniref:Terpene synthase n=1 Tax=Dichomitus squalens TaxID=114155 RepID=A0A4Q9M9Y6_9APHY|nr:terpenoid synthase [Dichomitus squalens]
MERTIYIPDTMAAWPWPRKFNPLYDEVNAESLAWVKSYKPYTPESQVAHDKGDPGRLAALSYIDAPHDRLRIGMDCINMLYMIDEYTDMESIKGVQEIREAVLDALRNTDKPRPEGEVILGEICQDFWARGRLIATLQAEKHFLDAMDLYLEGVLQQAEDRENHVIRTVDAYMEVRREDSGVRVCFTPGELHLSIPDEAFYHPIVKVLRDCSIDLVVLDNDVASYNREQAIRYEDWNILPVVMHQYGLDLYHATEWVASYHEEIEARFMDALDSLPSFGPAVDADLQKYTNCLAYLPRGNDCWRFESERFFGKRGLEVQETRTVRMFAKRVMNPEMRRAKIEIPLVEELEQIPFVATVED